MSPEVLILDEPTAHLDPRGKREIQSLIESLARQSGRTVVVVEQDVDWLAELVDRVVVLADGQIAMDGTPEDVLGSPEPLLELGVAPPQLSELAAGLTRDAGSPFAFIRMDQAERQLKEDLGGGA
jgi:energy-coupling factor transporter ATP-binding protein EcfA2